MKLNNLGDTIVEVIIAIAVVSVVLSGAFISSSQSLNSARAAQERTEALKLIQGQIDSMRFIAQTTPGLLLYRSKIFCLSQTTPIEFNINHGTLPAVDADNTNYPPSCKQGDNNRYRLSIDRPSTDTLYIRARWDKVGGGIVQEVKIVYKVHVL